MTAHHRILRTALLTTLLLFTTSCAAQDEQGSTVISRPATTSSRGVTVNRKPPEIKRRTFDRNNPPADLPKLSMEEAAVTTALFGVGPRMSVDVLNDRRENGRVLSDVKVSGIHVDCTLAITVWLPTDAKQPLKDHEEAHRRLFELYYEEADQVARQAAASFVGKVLRGEGPTPQAAREAAMKQAMNQIMQTYMSRTHDTSGKANDEFDRITDHGRKPVSVESAIRRSIELAGKPAGK